MSISTGAIRSIAIAACSGAAVLGSAGNCAAEPSGKLMGMLPSGFSSTNCQQVDPAAGSAERVRCDHGTGAPDGPTYAVFLLYASPADLATQFQQAAKNGYTLASSCTPTIASPSTWKRDNSSQVAGQIECGKSVDGQSAIIWTDTAKPWLAIVHGKDSASLYQWWHNTP
jgi:hypothetical protein